MKNLEEQAKETPKEYLANSPQPILVKANSDKITFNRFNEHPKVDCRVVAEEYYQVMLKRIEELESLTPQPIKVDAETGEVLKEPKFCDKDDCGDWCGKKECSANYHHIEYLNGIDPLEFIKRQKKKIERLEEGKDIQEETINQLEEEVKTLKLVDSIQDVLLSLGESDIKIIQQLKSKIKELEEHTTKQFYSMRDIAIARDKYKTELSTANKELNQAKQEIEKLEPYKIVLEDYKKGKDLELSEAKKELTELKEELNKPCDHCGC